MSLEELLIVGNILNPRHSIVIDMNYFIYEKEWIRDAVSTFTLYKTLFLVVFFTIVLSA